jgi:hypothetical protein
MRMKWLELTIIVCITGYALGLQASVDDIRFLSEKLESLMWNVRFIGLLCNGEKNP